MSTRPGLQSDSTLQATAADALNKTSKFEPIASEHSHPLHLAHHFDSPRQQFEAAKLGMWLFLATEVLLFGGLFCLYAVLRHNQPELFLYGSRFLDTNLGFINTVILILSSLTMAWGVRCAQLNQRRGLIICLLLTIMGGGGFMTIKYFEYSHKFHDNLVWGVGLYDEPEAQRLEREAMLASAMINGAPAAAEPVGDAAVGKTLWIATCRSCHDVDGRGIPGQGKDIRDSEWIAARTDKELVDFIKVGRMPFDKLNTTGIQMPPRGGNPMLTDANLVDIVAYLRTFMAPADHLETADNPANDAPTNAVADAQHEEFYIPMSSIPPAMQGPPGMSADWDRLETPDDRSPPRDPRRDPERPPNLHLFFGVYYLMTGLHGFHVVIGMLAMIWLMVRAWLGHFSSEWFTPVDLVGLYWHVVDIIWIFLFPLLYLIH